jgi:uncharacterized protein
MYFVWWHLPVLFCTGLIAESFGSIVGGGSLIMQPVLLFLGVPLKSSLAVDNAASLGTEIGILSETYPQVVKNKKLYFLILAPTALGGIIGTTLLLKVPAFYIKYSVVLAVILLLCFNYLQLPLNCDT